VVLGYAEPGIFLFKDLYDHLDIRVCPGNLRNIRRLRDVAHALRDNYTTVVLISPIMKIPIELSKDVAVVEFGTPSVDDFNRLLVDLINRSRRAKIVTIEDPVEYAHQNRASIVVQQEDFTDVPAFGQALTHVLRQDPDVVVIGEMRDLEPVATALTTAETGHLVLATPHTPDAVQTIQRIFSVFPHEQQHNIMYQLANTLQAVLAQRLLPRADG
jgi:hypothetical protein